MTVRHRTRFIRKLRGLRGERRGTSTAGSPLPFAAVSEAAPTRFDRDTAVRALGDGRFAATIDRAWWIGRGPHGGYVNAIVLRALTEALDDPSRSPRSLTVHFTAPPAEGPVEIAVQVERTGRSLTRSRRA